MLKVTGHSDDIVCVDGEIQEEFSCYDDQGARCYLAFSDGTVLSVKYDEDGIWRFSLAAKGPLFDSKQEGVVANDTNDVVTFKDGVTWCVFGTHLAVNFDDKTGEVNLTGAEFQEAYDWLRQHPEFELLPMNEALKKFMDHKASQVIEVPMEEALQMMESLDAWDGKTINVTPGLTKTEE